RLDLRPAEIRDLVGSKTSPVKSKSLDRSLSDGGRALDLVKTLIGMAPESRIPSPVYLINGLVSLLQPVPERLLAQRAMALTAKLIGNVPQDHSRMMVKPFCQFHIDIPHLFPVRRGSKAGIVTQPEDLS